MLTFKTIDGFNIADDVKQSLNPGWQSKLERARGGVCNIQNQQLSEKSYGLKDLRLKYPP